MPVAIHRVTVSLFWIDATGKALDKNSPDTKLNDIVKAPKQEHRIMPNVTGSVSTPSSAGHPTIDDYLQAEADAGFALAYMDQYSIVTQMIT